MNIDIPNNCIIINMPHKQIHRDLQKIWAAQKSRPPIAPNTKLRIIELVYPSHYSDEPRLCDQQRKFCFL